MGAWAGTGSERVRPKVLYLLCSCKRTGIGVRAHAARLGRHESDLETPDAGAIRTPASGRGAVPNPCSWWSLPVLGCSLVRPAHLPRAQLLALRGTADLGGQLVQRVLATVPRLPIAVRRLLAPAHIPSPCPATAAQLMDELEARWAHCSEAAGNGDPTLAQRRGKVVRVALVAVDTA